MALKTPVKDRIPTYPGRVTLTPVSGQTNTYDLVRADQPLEVGTPINKSLFDQKAYTLTENVTVYVSKSGNDTTGDGTSAAPYATVQKAVDSLPKWLDGYTATISIASGTYAEDLSVKGFQGGVLSIGIAGNSVVLRSISIESSSFVQINITSIVNTGKGGIVARYGSRVEILSEMSIDCGGGYNSGLSATTGSIIGFTVDLFDIMSISVKNCGFCAIYAGTGSMVHLSGITGSGNAVGFRADEGGVITYGTSSLSATTATITTKGGRIYSGAQTSVPKY